MVCNGDAGIDEVLLNIKVVVVVIMCGSMYVHIFFFEIAVSLHFKISVLDSREWRIEGSSSIST
jgi:hypothetical protein